MKKLLLSIALLTSVQQTQSIKGMILGVIGTEIGAGAGVINSLPSANLATVHPLGKENYSFDITTHRIANTVLISFLIRAASMLDNGKSIATGRTFYTPNITTKLNHIAAAAIPAAIFFAGTYGVIWGAKKTGNFLWDKWKNRNQAE